MPLKASVFTGDRFGQLVVIAEVDRDNGRRFLCRCDCGAEKIVQANNLRSGNSTSCGGHRRPGGRKTHGLSGSPTWISWSAMKSRCYWEPSAGYAYYGGRGICVCDRWLGRDGFENFLADMGERPEGMTLDRIDSDGDYEPSNCRFATPLEQIRNRRVAGINVCVECGDEFEAKQARRKYCSRRCISRAHRRDRAPEEVAV